MVDIACVIAACSVLSTICAANLLYKFLYSRFPLRFLNIRQGCADKIRRGQKRERGALLLGNDKKKIGNHDISVNEI